MIDLADLGTQGEEILGPQAYAQIGASVASAGDFNNDGYEDFVFTGPVTDAVNQGRGVAYLVFGRAGGIGAVDLNAIAQKGFAIYGPPTSIGGPDGVGVNAASAGDVNGDGFDDLVIGMPRDNTNGTFSGSSYIVYGHALGFPTIDLATMTADQGSKIVISPYYHGPSTYGGTDWGPFLGESVASAGDVNNDGFDDVILGATFHSTEGAPQAGAAFLLFGSAEGIGNVNLATMTASQGYALLGTEGGGTAGRDVAGLGDVNGDGIDDFAVAIPTYSDGDGKVVVRFGIDGGAFSGGLAPSASEGFVISGAHYTGYHIAGAGDVNGDGYQDMLVAQYGGEATTAYLLWGKASFGAIDLAALDAEDGIRIDRSVTWGTIGDVAAAGDVNGDGFDDIAIGIYDSTGTVASTDFVVYGSAGLSAITLGTSAGLSLQTGGDEDYLGMSLGAADLDSDGFSDVLAGAWGSQVTGDYAGAVYAVYGERPTGPVVRTGTVASQTLAGGAFNDTLSGLGGDDDLHGNEGADTLDGGDGNDRVDGGAGVDTMAGGAGDDLIWATYGDSANGGTGTDILYLDLRDGGAGVTVNLRQLGDGMGTVTVGGGVLTGIEYVDSISLTDFADMVTAPQFPSGAGPLTMHGWGGDDALDGSMAADEIHGGDGNDVLNGGDGLATGSPWGDSLYGEAGDDTITGGFDAIFADGGVGDDHIDGSFHGDTLFGDADDDVLDGREGNDSLFAGDGTDVLTGGDGNDRLDSGLGDDTMSGGLGDDWYFVYDAGDQVIEAAGGGVDEVIAYTSWVVAAGQHVERVVLAGTPGANDLTGNELANQLEGNALANLLTGGAGNDQLDGRGGSDTVIGGTGDDFYLIDSAGDQVIEHHGEGDDTLATLVSYTLAATQSIETLYFGVLSWTQEVTLRGNDYANHVYGNDGNGSLYGMGGNDELQALAGNDRLDGGTGSDTMYGGQGDDWYFVDNSTDRVFEASDQGADRVLSSASFTLFAGAYVELLTTTNNAGTDAINLTGNEVANTIYGNAGANVLNGAGGADVLVGFGGDDWYYVDDAGDVVSEAAGGGNDRIFASASYTMGLGVEVERLTTDDNGSTLWINLTGNELANLVYGNAGGNVIDGRAGNDTLVGLAGNDTLVGGLGNDTMAGGLGDDLYYVDSAGDVVNEGSGEGSADRVLASVSYALNPSAQVELLTTSNNAGTAAINLTGNAIANTIYGNAGANTLDGRGGADIMVGFAGDDRYYVDNAGDVVSEAAGGGSDRVFASVSYTLSAAAQVELMTTTNNAGTAAIDLTGNGFANTIYGNAGANVLDGKGGADILVGLAGADSFAFTTALGGGNVDVVTDFAVADDTIVLENAVFAGLATGALAAGAFATGAAASEADDRIVYNAASGALLFDADGSGAGAAVQFATLAGGLALTSADFLAI